MDSFIETFHIDWQIMLAQAINFIIVLFVLYYLALKPLKKLMKERAERIEKGIKDAESNELMLVNTKKEYEMMLARVRHESQEIIGDAKKEAEVKKLAIIELAKQESEKIFENGKKMLETEKAKIMEEAKEEIVSLVVKATEKLLESHTDNSYNEKALDKINSI